MKHLPKHLRPKWRYVAVGVEADPDADLDRGDLQRELWYSAQNLLGDAGSADVDGTVVRFRASDGDAEAVVRARRGEVESLRAALACIASVDGTDVAVSVRGASGTIRACQEKYFSAPPEVTRREDVSVDGADGTGVVRDDRVAVADDGWTYATTADVE